MFNRSRRSLVASAVAGLTFLAAAVPAVAQNYPVRPITMIVPWGAGGGTDAVARIVASLLEKDLGQPVTVVNRTGGSGVVGHAAIASAPADGYTIGLATVEIGMMHWQGLTQLTGASYTPIGLVNADPRSLYHVNASHPRIRAVVQHPLYLQENCLRQRFHFRRKIDSHQHDRRPFDLTCNRRRRCESLDIAHLSPTAKHLYPAVLRHFMRTVGQAHLHRMRQIEHHLRR